MNYLIKNLKQTVVYWGNPETTGVGYSYDNAIEINGRWEDRQEIFIDADGRKQLSQAVVYVDQDVDVNGYLYLGELEDLGDSSSAMDWSDPQIVSGSYMIRAFKKTPNLKATDWMRKVWL